MVQRCYLLLILQRSLRQLLNLLLILLDLLIKDDWLLSLLIQIHLTLSCILKLQLTYLLVFETQNCWHFGLQTGTLFVQILNFTVFHVYFIFQIMDVLLSLFGYLLNLSLQVVILLGLAIWLALRLRIQSLLFVEILHQFLIFIIHIVVLVWYCYNWLTLLCQLHSLILIFELQPLNLA